MLLYSYCPLQNLQVFGGKKNVVSMEKSSHNNHSPQYTEVIIIITIITLYALKIHTYVTISEAPPTSS